MLFVVSCNPNSGEERIGLSLGKYSFNEKTGHFTLLTQKDGYFEGVQWDKNWNLISISIYKDGNIESKIFKNGKVIRIEKRKDTDYEPYYVKHLDE
ncbi:hypothetical protein DLM77_20850 [Leptospira yasudae]|uniref:Lipoprotein n=1 Tax=Leptospira yasudae TaxID=2202201 RepID=A0ABX9LZA0_9LEPT|nr:hypothetical protein DLM77_20850 [Leptospira yasudae]